MRNNNKTKTPQYYICDRDLYSVVIYNRKKFTKGKIYKRVKPNVYINDQGMKDDISIEGWQRHFIPIQPLNTEIKKVEDVKMVLLVGGGVVWLFVYVN